MRKLVGQFEELDTSPYIESCIIGEAVATNRLTEFLLANILNRTMKSKVRSHQACRSSRKEEGGTKTVTSTLSVI